MPGLAYAFIEGPPDTPAYLWRYNAPMQMFRETILYVATTLLIQVNGMTLLNATGFICC